MKKAVHIVSLIYAPVLILAIVMCFISALIIFNVPDDVLNEIIIKGKLEMDLATARSLVVLIASATMVVAFLTIPGVVFSFIIYQRNVLDADVENGTTGLVLSILSIIFGAAPVGVLYIIRNSLARKSLPENIQ